MDIEKGGKLHSAIYQNGRIKASWDDMSLEDWQIEELLTGMPIDLDSGALAELQEGVLPIQRGDDKLFDRLTKDVQKAPYVVLEHEERHRNRFLGEEGVDKTLWALDFLHDDVGKRTPISKVKPEASYRMNGEVWGGFEREPIVPDGELLNKGGPVGGLNAIQKFSKGSAVRHIPEALKGYFQHMLKEGKLLTKVPPASSWDLRLENTLANQGLGIPPEQKRVIRNLMDKGFTTEAYRGVEILPRDLHKMRRMLPKGKSEYGGDHVDLTLDARQAETRVPTAERGSIFPALIATPQNPVFTSDRISNSGYELANYLNLLDLNAPGNFGLDEVAMRKIIRDAGHDTFLYPNHVEGSGTSRKAAEQQTISKTNANYGHWADVLKDDEHPVIWNPSALITDPEFIRMTLETDDLPGKFYRGSYASGGAVKKLFRQTNYDNIRKGDWFSDEPLQPGLFGKNQVTVPIDPMTPMPVVRSGRNMEADFEKASNAPWVKIAEKYGDNLRGYRAGKPTEMTGSQLMAEWTKNHE